jgi:hypothetical protein
MSGPSTPLFLEVVPSWQKSRGQKAVAVTMAIDLVYFLVAEARACYCTSKLLMVAILVHAEVQTPLPWTPLPLHDV